MVRRRNNRRARGGRSRTNIGILEYTLPLSTTAGSEPYVVLASAIGFPANRPIKVIRAQFEFGNTGSGGINLAQLAIVNPSANAGEALEALGQARYCSGGTSVTARVNNRPANSFYNYLSTDAIIRIYYGSSSLSVLGLLRLWVAIGNETI